MTDISTHVLDTATGVPAAGIAVSLERRAADGGWSRLGGARTDADGRARGLAGDAGAAPGAHRLLFATGARLSGAGRPPAFFDEVIVSFVVGDEPHLHIPLLLSPYGYTVYRGS